MLKIKDNVDLKELEKFGFAKFSRDRWDLMYMFDDYAILVPQKQFYDSVYLVVNNKTRILSQIIINDTGDKINEYVPKIIEEFYLFDNLNDLIKADLVEKVSDGNE